MCVDSGVFGLGEDWTKTQNIVKYKIYTRKTIRSKLKKKNGKRSIAVLN